MTRRRFTEARGGRGYFEDAEPAERPPIVFITVDMVPPDFYRREEINGGIARTPNIDRLRAGGVEFTDAFANAPLCGPSRASYLTGRYPYVIVNEERAHDGWATSLRADDIIFPEYLKAAGYVTKHAGKSHVGAEPFRAAFGEIDAPWNRWAPPMTDDDGYVSHLRRLGVTPPVYRNPIQGLRGDRKTPGNVFGGFVTQANGGPFPEEATYAHYLAELVNERVDAAMLQGAGDKAPIYLQADFFEPHQPFMIPAGCEKRAEELRKKVKVPKSYHELRDGDFARPRGEPFVYELYRRDMGLYDEATLVEYMISNILEMEVLDRAIGKVLAALERRGLYDRALVVFAADHGEMNGEKALVDKGVYGHPRVARVPLAVKLPGGANAGRRVETPVCLLDVAPTILEAAGVRPAARLDGMSLWPLLGASGEEAPGEYRERVFLFEACWHMAANPAVSIQWRKSPSEHFFYTYNLTSEYDELYDLADTSYPNLAGDPRFAGVRRQMVERLAGFLRADPRWRCYWHTMRLGKQDQLPPEAGDAQMFRPE